MFGEPLEHDLECAARLAGGHHGDEQRVEIPLVLRQSVGEALAALHRAADMPDSLRQPLMLGVGRGEREDAVERHSGSEQRGRVPGPQR